MDLEDPQFTHVEIEHRRYRRVKLVIQVDCEVLERTEVAVTRDLSAGGMFINARHPVPVDTDLSLTFRLYPTEPAIKCRAKVMFSRVGLGMGVQFLDLSAETRQMLQKFVDEVG